MMKPVFISQKQTPIKKIDPGTVVYLHTKGNYTKLYFADKSFWEVRSSLYGALKKLPEEMFVRISESTAVSIYYIDSIYRDYLVLVGRADEPRETKTIGTTYYKALIKYLDVIGKT
jgi:DNA-binding LytR/AlgR family response regulator